MLTQVTQPLPPAQGTDIPCPPIYLPHGMGAHVLATALALQDTGWWQNSQDHSCAPQASAVLMLGRGCVILWGVRGARPGSRMPVLLQGI